MPRVDYWSHFLVSEPSTGNSQPSIRHILTIDYFRGSDSQIRTLGGARARQSASIIRSSDWLAQAHLSRPPRSSTSLRLNLVIPAEIWEIQYKLRQKIQAHSEILENIGGENVQLKERLSGRGIAGVDGSDLGIC